MSKLSHLLILLAAAAVLTQIAAAQTTRTADESEKQTRLTDFEDAAAAGRWKTVNDGVMGGKSKGGMSVKDGVMTFAGSINTDGGGFSSVRMKVEPGTLADANRLLLRVKGDGRTYRLTVEDDRGDPERRPNFGKDMEAGPAGEWRTVSVALADMKPTFHGEPVDAKPLQKDRIVEVGIILSDGRDGPFTLDVDWIDAAE